MGVVSRGKVGRNRSLRRRRYKGSVLLINKGESNPTRVRGVKRDWRHVRSLKQMGAKKWGKWKEGQAGGKITQI